MRITINEMSEADIEPVANIHTAAFQRQLASKKWVAANFRAYPRILLFVARLNDVPVGYIQWIQKSGFRAEAVVELEQIAVLPAYQGQGIGERLIDDSLSKVRECLATHGSILKAVIVSTRSDNCAQKLYRKTLGARIVATVEDLYSADEVLMIRKYDFNEKSNVTPIE